MTADEMIRLSRGRMYSFRFEGTDRAGEQTLTIEAPDKAEARARADSYQESFGGKLRLAGVQKVPERS